MATFSVKVPNQHMPKLSFKQHLLYNVALGSMFLAFGHERFNRQEAEKDLGDTRALIKAISTESNKSFITDTNGNNVMFTHVPSKNFHYLLNDFFPLRDTQKHENFNADGIAKGFSVAYDPLREDDIKQKIDNTAHKKFEAFKKTAEEETAKQSFFTRILHVFK